MVCCKVFYTAPPRHMLMIIVFLALTLALCMRQVMPITIQEMTYPILGKGPRLKKDYGEKYEWNDFEQAFMLMGFYIGYSIGHFFCGPIINKLGARGPLAVGMILSATITALIPFACRFDWTVILSMRVVTGLGQSTLLPGISNLLTYWIPLEDRATTAAIIYAAVPLGNFLGIYVSAIVVTYWEYWPNAYYMWASFTYIWICFFLRYIYSYPQSHPRIITQGSSYQRASFIMQEERAEQIEKLAYCSQTMATFGHTYMLFTLDNYLPKYLNEVLEYELEDYSLYAATPFAAMYISGFISRAIFTALVYKRNIGADFLRVIYCSLFNVVAGAVLVVAIAFGLNNYATIALIHLASFLSGFFYGGLNMLDMSWRDTHLSMSIVYGIATTSGVAAIMVVAFMVKDGTVEEWLSVGYILLSVEALMWIMDSMFTMTKLCLVSYTQDKKWYQHIPVEEHKEMLAARKAAKEELALKQRGKRETIEEEPEGGPSKK